MTRTVQVRAARMKPWRMTSPGDSRPCGFCSTRIYGGRVEHHLCPGSIGPWKCPCAQAGHPETGNPGPALDPVE